MHFSYFIGNFNCFWPNGMRKLQKDYPRNRTSNKWSNANQTKGLVWHFESAFPTRVQPNWLFQSDTAVCFSAPFNRPHISCTTIERTLDKCLDRRHLAEDVWTHQSQRIVSLGKYLAISKKPTSRRSSNHTLHWLQIKKTYTQCVEVRSSKQLETKKCVPP